MRIHTSRFLSLLAVAFLAIPWLPVQVSGASFTYTNGDLIACFRVEGGSSDLVVNLGPAAAFEGLPWGSEWPMTNITSAQLEAAFPSLVELKWSVLGAMRGNVNYPQYPLQTIWTTSPAPEPEVMGAVWKRQSQFTQGPIASQIDAIGLGAALYGSQTPAGPYNTATGVVISSTDQNAYTALVGAGNLADTFQGDVENRTSADFGPDQPFSRSLLYKLVPGPGAFINPPGEVIGYFDFYADGTATFTAGPIPVRITSIQRNEETTVLSFSTLPHFSYRLRSTDAAGLQTPIADWTVGTGAIIGDGTLHQLSATNDAVIQFFAIEVIP